jgi:thiamine-phosphate pyrophosphorylase
MNFPRLYPILDTATLERRGVQDWCMVARAWLAGGAEIVQIRHKASWTRSDFEKAKAVKEECRRAGAPLIVNDRADIAAVLNSGLHVGQEDLAPSDCRRMIGPQTRLGYSTHNETQIQIATNEPIDYVAFGPVFATQSKERPDPLVGLNALRAARALTSQPLVAIGGISQPNARQALAAGADAVAVIAALLPEQLTASSIQETMEQWQRLTRQ